MRVIILSAAVVDFFEARDPLQTTYLFLLRQNSLYPPPTTSLIDTSDSQVIMDYHRLDVDVRLNFVNIEALHFAQKL